ncbi:hypothetical protein GPALN_009800 [Globodera pallida]|nr:hypothetical protein GPALN_009800 [Globodera pallida]
MPGATFIRNLKVHINQREVYDSNQLYSYKAYLDTELSYPIAEKDSYFGRKKPLAESKAYQTISKLSADISNQDLLLDENEGPSSAAYYGGAIPSQQAPMDDTFVPSQAGTHSTNWFGEDLQGNDGSLQSMVNPKNPSLFKSALGFVSTAYYGSAMPFQQAPMTGTSFPAFPYQSFNQSAQLNSSTNFVPSQAGTYSTNFFGGNSQNNEGDLYEKVELCTLIQ